MSSSTRAIDTIIDRYRRGYYLNLSLSGHVVWDQSMAATLIPLDGRLHVWRSLRQVIRSGRYLIRFDTQFEQVLLGCMNRPDSWVVEPIAKAYRSLFQAGYSHSVEVYDEADRLVGGLIGHAIGRAFIGETMFNTSPSASQVGLVALVAKLRDLGFWLLDAQMPTDNTMRFGGMVLPRPWYLTMLEEASEGPSVWQG